MPRLPNIPIPTVPLPGTGGTRRRPTPPLPTPPPSRSARAKLKRELRLVQKKIEVATKTFYEVGVQLNVWKKTQSWRALSSSGDFKTFVVTHVAMSYSRANRLMTVAEEYPKSVAAKLGIEKGFQLVRYARLADTQALALVQRDAGLGSPPTPISELSAQQIEGLVLSLSSGAARAAAPKPTREDKRVARVFARRITAELGVDLDAHVDKKRNKLCLEVDLDLAREAI